MTRYIDATGSSSLVMSDELYNVLAKARGDGLRLAQFLLDPYIAHRMVTTAQVNYLDASEGGKITYLPASRSKKEWWRTTEMNMLDPGRQEATAGRVLRKLLTADALTQGVTVPYLRDPTQCVMPKPKVTDEDIEKLTVFIQASFLPLDPFIVTGEAIRYWYFEENYTDQEHGTLLKESCMRYAQHWNDVRFYAQNPLVIGMLCALDSKGKLKARALLWNAPGGIVMDRVYGSDQSAAAFRRFAQDRGWTYRVSDMTERRNINRSGTVIVPLQHLNMRQKPPFLDTFSLFPFRATGDRAMARDHAGRLVGYEDCNEPWLTGSDNPVTYAAAVLKEVTIPSSHPIKRRSGHDMRDAITVRDRRVDWLSDFSWVPPWPDDLVRTNPEWTLERWGSDAEDDTANLARLPPRRTEALVIEPPPRGEEAPTGVSLLPSDGIDAASFQRNVVLLNGQFARSTNAVNWITTTNTANTWNATWNPAGADNQFVLNQAWNPAPPGAPTWNDPDPLVNLVLHDFDETERPYPDYGNDDDL